MPWVGGCRILVRGWRLEVFAAARNNLTGVVEGLGNATGLVQFDISQNSLAGPIPDPSALTLLTFQLLLRPLPHHPRSPLLKTCRVDPVVSTSCPTATILEDPTSLAAKCAIKCRGGGAMQDAGVVAVVKTAGAAKGGDRKSVV